MSEKNLQTQILNQLGSRTDIRLFRNTSGHGVQGTIIDVGDRAGDIYVKNARRVTWGLCKGSSDLIGIKKVKITPEMVGQEIGQFVSIEVKAAKGRLTDEQKAWLAMVESFGGLAVVVRAVGDIEI